MKLIVHGEGCIQNTFCWRAITAAIEGWESPIDGAKVEAEVDDQDWILKLTLHTPGRDPVSAELDICWIAYSDQAERLSLQATRTISDLETALKASDTALESTT
jgi:hypothetical protein